MGTRSKTTGGVEKKNNLPSCPVEGQIWEKGGKRREVVCFNEEYITWKFPGITIGVSRNTDDEVTYHDAKRKTWHRWVSTKYLTGQPAILVHDPSNTAVAPPRAYSTDLPPAPIQDAEWDAPIPTDDYACRPGHEDPGPPHRSQYHHYSQVGRDNGHAVYDEDE